MQERRYEHQVGAPEMNPADEPAQVDAVLDEVDARVGGRGGARSIRLVVDAKEESRDELHGDQHPGQAAEVAVESGRVVWNAAIQFGVYRLDEGEALVQPSYDRCLKPNQGPPLSVSADIPTQIVRISPHWQPFHQMIDCLPGQGPGTTTTTISPG